MTRVRDDRRRGRALLALSAAFLAIGIGAPARRSAFFAIAVVFLVVGLASIRRARP